jgi:hypothetical protein
MIEHIIKKHVTLRAAAEIKAPEPRILSDSLEGGRDATKLRREGDGPCRGDVPLEEGPFLRGIAQWKAEGLSKGEAHSRPFRDEESRA